MLDCTILKPSYGLSAAALVICLALAGCTPEEQAALDEGNPADIVISNFHVTDVIEEMSVEEFNAFWLPQIPEADGVFELTEQEYAIYLEYLQTGDISLMYGLEPLSVMMISIQAAIDGQFEREFGLFYPDSLGGVTIYQYLPPPGSTLEETGTTATRQRFADRFYAGLREGTVNGDENRVSVSFLSEDDQPITMWASKNADGIWLVELD